MIASGRLHPITPAIEQVSRHRVGTGQDTELAADQAERPGQIRGRADDPRDRQEPRALPEPCGECRSTCHQLGLLPGCFHLELGAMKGMRRLVNQPCKLLTRSVAEPQWLGAVQRQDTEKSIVAEDRETQETREPAASPPVSADKARIGE